jgi:UDP-N-acetylmuramate dehydrogenase
MKVIQNQDIKKFNTFGIQAKASGLVCVTSANDIYEILLNELKPYRILGGGSNILLTTDIDGYVLKNEIKGIQIIDEDDQQVVVEAGAGEQWHQFVMWSISHNLGGIENLSLIPGSVGAAPMQNIGAYGVEQEACFHSLTAIDMETGVPTTFFKEQCNFGYRESIFKNEAKDRYFIVAVRYMLTKNPTVFNLDYGAIKDQLASKGISAPTIQDVSEAVIAIRQSKLPNPREIGNAGSFFKNPVVSSALYERLLAQYPDLPSYPIDEATVKVPAGWLIEKAGFKGLQRGQIGVHKAQALVLVNYGGGNGHDIYALAIEIKDKVKDIFDVDIYPEVNIW